MNLARLKPPDFRAVAAAGAYVYCYLRHKDSATAAVGTPYYIGIATTARRPFSKHSGPVPCNRSLVRILRADLSWADACKWERFYIKRYGRKDLGTGILLNLTDGGEGAPNPSPDVREKIRAFHTGRKRSAQTIANLKAVHGSPAARAAKSAAMKGRTFSEESRIKMSVAMTGKPKTAEHRAKLAAANKGKPVPLEVRAKQSAQRKGKAHTPEHTAKIAVTRLRNTAIRYGICPKAYAALAPNQRAAVITRHRRGKHGAELLHNLPNPRAIAA